MSRVVQEWIYVYTILGLTNISGEYYNVNEHLVLASAEGDLAMTRYVHYSLHPVM